MEEIITLDGRQFKLTVDRPLTATEKAQVLTEIRKQTGCSTCGPRVANMGNDWQYGGIHSLIFDSDVTGDGTGPKGSGSTVTLKANPLSGVGPYDVRFWRSNTGASPITTDITNASYMGSTEGVTVTATYVITDIDVAAAVGNTLAQVPSAVNTTTGVITLGGATTALTAGSIRFYSSIVDSCKGALGPGVCAQYADVTLTCVAPTCNFVVT
mgnify:CR=1 FL=1